MKSEINIVEISATKILISNKYKIGIPKGMNSNVSSIIA
jgi:hypothetical protein